MTEMCSRPLSLWLGLLGLLEQHGPGGSRDGHLFLTVLEGEVQG